MSSTSVSLVAANVHAGEFLSGTLFLVFLPAVVAVAILLPLAFLVDKRSAPKPDGLSTAGAAVSAFFLGAVAATGWLSWSGYSGFDGVTNILDHGPPTEFPKWQIAGCGLTLILGSLVISAKAKRIASGASATVVLTTVGFSTMFSLASAIHSGPNPQAGIGVALSMMGIGTLLFLCHIPLVVVLRSKRKTPQAANTAGR